MSIQEKREQLATVLKQSNELLTSVGNKAMTKDQQAAHENLMDQSLRLQREIQDMTDVANNAGRTFEASQLGSEADDPDAPVMRNADDFRKHYFAKARQEGMSTDKDRVRLLDFMRGVANLKTTRAAQNSLSVGTDSQGGFTVPAVVMPEILEALVPNSSLLQAGAAIVPRNDGAKSYTLPGIQTLPTAAWRNENGAVAESDPVFRALTAAPKSLAVFFKVSRELLADSSGMNAALRKVLAQAFAKEMDRVGLRGTGTAPEPKGILNTLGIQAVSNGVNGASLATLRYGNFLTALQSILGADAPMPTAAIMSPRSRVGLASLIDTTNQPLAAPPMVSDLKMLTSSQIPNTLTVGTSTDCTEIYMGDFSQVQFVLRENLSIQLLDQTFATTGQVGFIAHMRLDILVPYAAGLAVVTGVRP
ncbi:MAG: phage major capsid protein [Roseateles depolymerans]|uniref:Phage major capsid protein n=1 Tax=Roseateles depolymerans TaxID=76731 RepID=A0A2W5FD04_9BURK|nr:MAG: phage major capsid protein [Roseateles depolymerans]